MKINIEQTLKNALVGKILRGLSFGLDSPERKAAIGNVIQKITWTVLEDDPIIYLHFYGTLDSVFVYTNEEIELDRKIYFECLGFTTNPVQVEQADKPFPVYIGDVVDRLGDGNYTFDIFPGVRLSEITGDEIVQAYKKAFASSGVIINDVSKEAWLESRYGEPKPTGETVIKIEHGEVFEGSVMQFRDCFFDNVTRWGVEDWAKKHGWHCEIIGELL